MAALRQPDHLIYIIALIASLTLSFWIGERDSVINPDGICYLLSAQILGFSSIKEAMHFCPQAQWPFYSTLIYTVVKISHLSYHTAANVLNAGFSLLSVMTFILIMKELGGTRRILWLAAFVILFDHQFNVFCDNIIRDHGFWAFYLLSMYYLLRFFRDQRWTMAFAWNVSLFIATLFRIEGVIFLCALPLVAWFYPDSFKQRAKSFITLNLPMLVLGFSLAIWFISHPYHSVDKLGRVGEILYQIQHGFFMLIDRYQTAKNSLIQHVLPPDSASDASVALFFMWIGMYLYNVALTLSWGYAALLIYAIKNRIAPFAPRTAPVIWAYLFINVVVTLIFLAEHLFISKRYLMALTLVLLLWMPFVIEHLIQRWENIRHRVFLLVTTAIILLASVSGVIQFGYSKLYIRSAGDWLANHVPSNASLYSNDIQLMYYTKHFDTRIFETFRHYLPINTIANGQWKQYDFLALRLGRDEEVDMAAILQEFSELAPVQVFNSKRGNRIAIYKISKEEA